MPNMKPIVSSVGLSILLLFLILTEAALALPLSTNSRWIVNENGRRVKLACVNWPSHLQAVVAEGLSKQPMAMISKKIVSMGFNCVRFTWPLALVTNDTLAKTTVRQSFQGLGLLEDIAGVQANNPSILDIPLIKAFQEVVSNMGKHNVMVILDNHLTIPGWCCNQNDGNGFFGDKYFDPDIWIHGLTKMATLFHNVANVVGMSLRNELRGQKQNVDDWYRCMQRGADAVHSANPNVLVILSGLSFDKDLSFVQTRHVNVTFTKKLVYEVHWYAFSDGDSWKNGNPNQVCGRVVNNMKRMSMFLLEQGFPLFMSEFGIDERGLNVNDNRYFNCFLGLAAEFDLDWALWALTGSYYLREGQIGLNEYYGIMDRNWRDVRNSTFLERISFIQSPLKGPGLSETSLHKLIFHPETGLCVIRQSKPPELTLGPCKKSESWTYTEHKTLSIKNSQFCLEAEDETGKSAKLGQICTGSNSKWDIISDSKMHLSATTTKGLSVCLDVNNNKDIIVNRCKCINDDKMCDPASQWFKLVDSTRTGSESKLDIFGQELLSICSN